MKKITLPKIAMLMLLLAVITFAAKSKSQAPPVEPEQNKLEALDQALQKEIDLCDEFKRDNSNIRYTLIGISVLAKDEERRAKLGKLMMSVEKADKLIKACRTDLANTFPHEAPEKLPQIKKKLDEICGLHINASKGLSVFLNSIRPNPLRLLEI